MHSLPLFSALSKLVAVAGLRVLLTGEDADELFYGYEKYAIYSAGDTSVQGDLSERLFLILTTKETMREADEAIQ